MNVSKDKFAVLDFETDPAEYGHVPAAFACGFFDGALYEYVWSNTESDVLRWAGSRVSHFPGVTYAHNGGRFDFLGYLFRQNPELLYGQKARLIGSRIVQMKYGAGEVRDSYAILPAPLAAYDKGEIDIITKFRRGIRDKYREEILMYLKRDCTSLHSLVSVFRERHGKAVLTAASAGMRFAKELGIDLPRLDDNQDAIFRQFYFGGRVEAFWTGAKPGKYFTYDIKSAYPHAMLANHAAASSFQFIANPETIRDTDFVVCTGSFRGCFPLRTDKGLRYPHVSEGDFHVTGWEYNEAARLGLLGPHTVKYIERPDTEANFRAYVDFWFEEKERCERAGDAAGRLVAKIMLNSLYGKYAQRPDRWREYTFVSDKDILTPRLAQAGWEEEYVDEENHFAVWSQPSQRPPQYYNVATAASITGFVRSRIMRAVASWRPLYTDTDSVVLEHPIEGGHGIGSWSLEVEGDYFACAGKKLYALRLLKQYCRDQAEAKKKNYYWDRTAARAWKVASKGCRMTPKEMVRVALGGEVKTFNQFPTFSIHSGTRFISRTIRKTA